MNKSLSTECKCLIFSILFTIMMFPASLVWADESVDWPKSDYISGTVDDDILEEGHDFGDDPVPELGYEPDGPIYWVMSTQRTHNDSCELYLTGTGRYSRVPTGLNCPLCGGDKRIIKEKDLRR